MEALEVHEALSVPLVHCRSASCKSSQFAYSHKMPDWSDPLEIVKDFGERRSLVVVESLIDALLQRYSKRSP